MFRVVERHEVSPTAEGLGLGVLKFFGVLGFARAFFTTCKGGHSHALLSI